MKMRILNIVPNILYSLEQRTMSSVSQPSVGDDALALKHILANTPHSLKQSTLLKKELCTACDKAFTGFFINSGYKCLSKYFSTCSVILSVLENRFYCDFH